MNTRDEWEVGERGIFITDEVPWFNENEIVICTGENTLGHPRFDSLERDRTGFVILEEVAKLTEND